MMQDYEDAEIEQPQGWFTKLSTRLSVVRRLLFTLWTRALIVAATLIGLVCFAWHKYAQQILQDPKHTLTLQQIEITEQPSWIRGNIKDEVVREAGLDKIMLHDRRLVATVKAAFEVHAWVSEVVKVEKRPGRVAVQLKYRRPVAMVEVPTKEGRGLVFIDASGVILPTSSFSESQTRDFLRISVNEVPAGGPVGTPYGDQRVHGAARIAEAWLDHWKVVGLYRIVATDNSDVAMSPQRTSYELQTKEGSRVVWGRAIGHESPGETNATVKIAQLLQFVQKTGPLDDLAQPVQLDVRDGNVIQIGPHTASRSVPSK